MFIEELGRHLAVCSLAELERMLKMDARFWNVVSIREPHIPRPPSLRYAKRFHEVIFDDLERIDYQVASTPPRSEHIAGIFRFVDAHPSEPILIHCLAGLSRSTAVTLAVIIRGLFREEQSATTIAPVVARAVEILLRLRPQARPNALVLQFGLEQFLAADHIQLIVSEVSRHPILVENRSVKSRSNETQ
ncbi:MAG: hypothetical protein PCFJNLEI_02391 [Verrucomicrobiae bacterium]|nr:hypothetical protein [Verrucomicrobiae bacterium]